MATYMMVGFTPSSRQNIGLIMDSQENATALHSYKQFDENMSQQRIRQDYFKNSSRREQTAQLATPEDVATPEDLATPENDSPLLTEGNLDPAGVDHDINRSCREANPAAPPASLLADKPGLQHDRSPESTGSSSVHKGEECNIITPSTFRIRSHSHNQGMRNTSGDPTPGELRLEIGVDQQKHQLDKAKTNGSSDRDHMCHKTEDNVRQDVADRTAVDSLKAAHAQQKKYFIRSAIWDENGDIGACNVPSLPEGSHQKLRLCRSLDPNLLTNDPEPSVQSDAEIPSLVRTRTEKSGSLRVRPNKQKRFLRSIKSVDSVIPRSLETENNLDSSSGVRRLFSSPSTRRRFAYFSKLAAGMKTASSSNSPPHQGKTELRDHESHDSKSSSPPSSPPAGLTRGKLYGSPSSSVRLMPRKLWKGKALKPATDDLQQSAWTPQGNGLWQNTKGRRLQLFPKPLINLSDVERRHLKLVAQQKLQQLNLGQVNIPRDLSEFKKKKGLLKGGRNKATNFFDSLRDGKDSKDSAPLIFGIPLEKCLQNDQELRAIEAQRSRERRESLDLAVPPGGFQARRKSSRSLHSPQLSRKSSASSTALLEALSLSSSVNESHRRARRASLAPNVDLKIPRVVSACFRFIEAYGLRTEGIFRVSGSKKRVRQIRESYDRGDFVIFTREQSPHDVGALLKEYFRDLPEPLLTRDLYHIFTSITKFETEAEGIDIVRLAVCLLPIVHRDVLYALMRFLTRVAAEAERDLDPQGNEGSGSKMNATNLGTLFGPNILRKTKGGLASDKDKDFITDPASHVEKTRDVIEASCLLINKYKDVFQIPVSLQEEVLRTIADTDPDALDFILNRRNFENGIAEEPTKEAAPALSNLGNNSVVETTSSSSGTFPCVIDDSSLASLSTIEDLVNERNFSEFDANIPSIGSSDSLDALEADEHDPEITTIPDGKSFNHVNNAPVIVQSRDRQYPRVEGRPSTICNGPRIVTSTSSVEPPLASQRGEEHTKEGGLVLPHPPEKRASLGLYRETMIALGIDPEAARRGELGSHHDINCNRTSDNSCRSYLTDKDYPLRRSPSPTLPPRRSTYSSSVSSSSMSGSTSSSNASLVHVDQGIVDFRKKLPNYEEALQIKKVGVKSYATVNPSKYFVPVQPSGDEVGAHPDRKMKPEDSQETQEAVHSKLCRIDPVSPPKPCYQKAPPPYTDDRAASRESSPAYSPKNQRGDGSSIPAALSTSLQGVTITSQGGANDMSSATSSNIPREPAAGSEPPISSTVVTKRTISLPKNDHETPLLAWDNSSPSEMGAPTPDETTRKNSRAILNDIPPHISLNYSFHFLDLNDDDGEFDGPETYV